MEMENKTFEMLEKMEACGPLEKYLSQNVKGYDFMYIRNLVEKRILIVAVKGRYTLESVTTEEGEEWWLMTNEVTGKCVSFVWENETEEEKKYDPEDWVAMSFLRFIDANEIEIQKLRGLM